MPGALLAVPRPTEQRGVLQAGPSPCIQASLPTSPSYSSLGGLVSNICWVWVCSFGAH